jgi:predicted NUDIX family NTP pyrophosphohydrolase
MDVLDQVRIIVYRFHEKGLEIFLVNNYLEKDVDCWVIPESNNKIKMRAEMNGSEALLIELDPYFDSNGRKVLTYAIEGDWHDIPSVRGLIRQDLNLIKHKLKESLPNMEKSGFFAIKEALKKVLPNEYAALKELKDILWDRNVVTNI